MKTGQQNPNNNLTKKKLSFIVLAALAGVCIVYACVLYNAWKNPAKTFINDQISSRDEISIPENIHGNVETEPEAAPGTTEKEAPSASEFDNENIVNLLLLGIDSDSEREAKKMGWRSDMVMLCTLNFEKSSIALTTIPRDTRTKVYYVNQKGKATETEMTKINHAYAYGGGPDLYGAQNAMTAASDFLSSVSGTEVPVHYYVSLDLENLPKLADDMGGIPVTLDMDFPGLGNKGDRIVLNSENAALFLQNRYDVGGDIQRALHHEQFLKGMIDEIKKKGAANSAAALFGLATKYVKTNLSLQQVVALASILDNCDTGTIDYDVIDGEYITIDELSFFIADKKSVKKRVEDLMQ